MPMAKPGQDFRGEQKWGRCSRQREKHGMGNVHTRAVPPSKSGLLPTYIMSHAEFAREKPANHQSMPPGNFHGSHCLFTLLLLM